jgi:alpha-methylacyl-CoA racemase
MGGPLSDLRVIEIGCIGPGPFAGMILADHGADVICVERPGAAHDMRHRVLGRLKRVVCIDLKAPGDVAAVRALVRKADVLIEGFRPGTMERLDLVPELLLRDNPKLVYARVMGWGQTGPYASMAGHDLNYISLSGAEHAIGRQGEKPTTALALVGDFGGGGMLLGFAIMAAFVHSQKTGHGQVIDCAISEGAGLLMSAFFSGLAQNLWLDDAAST